MTKIILLASSAFTFDFATKASGSIQQVHSRGLQHWPCLYKRRVPYCTKNRSCLMSRPYGFLLAFRGTLAYNNRTEILSFNIVLNQKSLDKTRKTARLLGCWQNAAKKTFFSAFQQTFSPSYIVRDLTIQLGVKIAKLCCAVIGWNFWRRTKK